MKKTILATIATIAIVASSCCQKSCETDTKSCETCTNNCCFEDKLDSLKLVMIISFKIKPEHIDGFTKAINKCAAETVKEPGCLDYTIYQSPNDKSLFLLTEAWSDKPSHRAHMETAHIKTYFEEIKGMSDENNPRPNAVYRICPRVNQ